MSDALPAVEPFEQATRTTKNCLDCEACAYCGRPLHVSHEHDHFPLPARHGGMHVIPACRDCHSLKDRIAFNDWSQTAFTALLTALVSDAASPELRVFVAQAVNAMMDASQRAKDAEAQALVYERQLRQHGIEPKHVKPKSTAPVPKFGGAA